MGLFYAYLKSDRDGFGFRYLITFVNRETADEWWRLISTFPSPYAGNVRRISPQFYIQNPTKMNVVTTFFFDQTELPDAKDYLAKMFFTLLHDRDGRIMTTVPPVDITDHISGNWYFIRSKADARRYWYLRMDGECLICGDADCDVVHVSTEFRTRLCVRGRVLVSRGSQMPQGLVMIGSDEISIAASKDYSLRVNDAGELRVTKGYQGATSDILFGDLKHRFVTRAEKQGDGEIRESVVPVERGSGEPWELFD